MKITIESPVYDLDVMPQLFVVINLATVWDTLDELMDSLNNVTQNIHFLKYGRGGTHVWVSHRNKRILLITE